MDKYERRGIQAGTFHAQEKLKERYGLTYPLSDFIKWISEGRATEVQDPLGNRPRTKVFDVRCPGNEAHPAQTVRCVIGFGAKDVFVLTFLPLRWKSELFFERVKVKEKKNRIHYKEFRRANADEEINFEVQDDRESGCFVS